MKRVTLYSNSRKPSPLAREVPAVPAPRPGAAPAQTSPAVAAAKPSRWRRFATRYERPLTAAAGGLVAVVVVLIYAFTFGPKPLTQSDIDAAVLHTLDKQPPSNASIAYDIIRPSVVRVNQAGKDPEEDDTERAVGTGVVIEESGIILTNIHVVAGAERVEVVFSNGLRSNAHVISVQPEDDLAVLKADQIPDDLVPATLRSTRDLNLGDEVVAVGHPFGIGPSVSSGVISGLRREYVNPKGKKILSNLIQFDAAANPGNSGGPLVTREGEVVGIVTAILNPTDQRVFIGIGFAVPIENAASAAGMSPF
jgi:S1-C subfamily serine protease